MYIKPNNTIEHGTPKATPITVRMQMISLIVPSSAIFHIYRGYIATGNGRPPKML